MKSVSALILSCLALCLVSGGAQGLDSSRHLSQYGHSAWRIRDGYFNAAPTAITQSKDGYLWIGTVGGLIRFDGVKFVPLPVPLPTKVQKIYSLAPAGDVGLWIGLNRGLAHWKGHGALDYLPLTGQVDALAASNNGTMWLARAHTGDLLGPLCEVVETHLRCHGEADGLPGPNAVALTLDSAGNLWTGSGSQLSRWRPGNHEVYALEALDKAAGARDALMSGVQALAAAPDDSVWVGIDRAGPGLGLEHLINGKLMPLITSEVDTSKLEVQTLLIDRNHDLWVGTNTQGLYRIQGSHVEHFDSSSGLSGNTINCLFEDREGNLWVTTAAGVDSFQNIPIATFSRAEGLTADDAGSIVASRSGPIWIGNTGALDSLRDGRAVSIRWGHGLPGNQVSSMLEDSAGRLWVGIDNALYIVEKERFIAVPAKDGQQLGTVVALTEDSTHNIWAKVLRTRLPWLIRIEADRAREELRLPELSPQHSLVSDPRGGIWLDFNSGDVALWRDGRIASTRHPVPGQGRVYDLVIDPDGSLWIVTDGGLVSWHEDTARLLSVKNGLPCDALFAAIRDQQGTLWVSSACGLVRVLQTDIATWWRNPTGQLHTQLFDAAQGVLAGRSTFSPSLAVGTDGRIWFENDNQVQMLDPLHLDINPLPPPVHIEAIIADGRRAAGSNDVHLAPGIRDLEIAYTALSFVMPQRVRFRYQLQGHDLQWQDADTRRAAFYTNLSPGRYEFLLTACNSDGVCNEKGTKASFVIPPPWFQTWWFRSVCILCALSLCYYIYHVRMQRVTSLMKARFSERLNERTRIASELHDTLLQTISGTKLATDAALAGVSDAERTRISLEQISVWLERASLEVRAALESLHAPPSEANDLPAALAIAAREAGANRPMEVLMSVTGKPRVLNEVARDETYMIGYEAIRNAHNHSAGTRLMIEITYTHSLILCIADNGHGMDSRVLQAGKPGHFGLGGMRKRAARIGADLDLSSSATGTVMTLTVPARSAFSR